MIIRPEHGHLKPTLSAHLVMCCPAPWTYTFKRRILHLVITDSVPRATERGHITQGESPVPTRQNGRAEERPVSRADLHVHPLQTSTDIQSHTRTQTALLGTLDGNNWANQLNLCRDAVQTVLKSPAWKKIMRRCVSCFRFDAWPQWEPRGRWYSVLKRIVHILNRLCSTTVVYMWIWDFSLIPYHVSLSFSWEIVIILYVILHKARL